MVKLHKKTKNKKQKTKNKKQKTKKHKMWGGVWPQPTNNWLEYIGKDPDPKKVLGKGSYKTVLSLNENPHHVLINSTREQTPNKLKQKDEFILTTFLGERYPNTCVKVTRHDNHNRLTKFLFRAERLTQVPLTTREEAEFYLDGVDSILTAFSSLEPYVSCLDLKPENFGINKDKILVCSDIDVMLNVFYPNHYREYMLTVQRILLLGFLVTYYQTPDIIEICIERALRYGLTKDTFLNVCKGNNLDGSPIDVIAIRDFHKNILNRLGLTYSGLHVDESFFTPQFMLNHYLPIDPLYGFPLSYILLFPLTNVVMK